LIADGTIDGGMANKVKVLANFANLPGVGGVVILDGADKQAIEDELLTDAGAGTLIQSRPYEPSKEFLPVPKGLK
jgi:acetylglutamate kinase